MIPDLSVLWVVFFILLLATTLSRLLFAPVMRVMRQREGAIQAARELAEASAAKAAAASGEFDLKTQAARAEVYRQMDERRREALERRTAMLTMTRQEAEATLRQAADRVKEQAREARTRLRADADALAAAVVERVLGRNAS